MRQRQKPIALDIETRLRGSLSSHIANEFFSNTAYFPITKIILELLSEGTKAFFISPDLYALVTGAFIQAYFLGSYQYKGRPHPLAGNLIGPSIYTIAELTIERSNEFFLQPSHYTYWLFSFAIGLLQELRLHFSGKAGYALTLIENLVRTNILLVGYWIFEIKSEEKYASIETFLSDDTHIFIVVIISLIGLIIGMSSINAQSNLKILRETAGQLRLYSEWLLGRDILSWAVRDPDSLKLRRQERSVLFMDIRGFTQWSEAQPPEKVVDMLNAYFETAEGVWATSAAIKTKLTADEIMIVFPTDLAAAKTAVELQRIVHEFLRGYNLSAGIGLHSGPLTEGILGSKEIKGYEVIGDTVNTAERLCEVAEGNEILISQKVYTALGNQAEVGDLRQILVKGKAEPIGVYSLKGIS